MRKRREYRLLEEAIPRHERVRVFGVARLPFDRVLEIDALGDPTDKAPHVFCEFAGAQGPYTSAWYLGKRMGELGYVGELESSKRDETLFARLRQKTDLSDEAERRLNARIDEERRKNR
jgi:hypothetical protein